MPRSFPCWFALILSLLLTATAQAGVEATVDRNELALGETLQLTIQASGVRVLSQPDLTPLETDFDVLGKSQSSSTRLINGEFTSSTSWTLQLAPRRAGRTSIPPIRVGRDRTDTIEIQVVPAAQAARPAADDDEVRLEAALADTTVYVGAQALLTLRVSRSPAVRFQLEEPEHPDVSIRQVSDRSYQEIRGGRRVMVSEYTFALFPAVEGELVLQPLTLVADIMSQTPRSMFDPLLGKTRRVIRRTEPLSLNVIPAPDEIPAAQWLPAERLSLSESWSKDPQHLSVGDSVTRTIDIEARGVTAAQLPPLLMGDIDGLKFYPDQPTVADDTGAAGVTGRRTEKMAMVVTRPGRYQLPEQRIDWWDVKANAPRVARLPAMTFEVAPAATGGATAAAATELPATAGIPAAPRPWYDYPLWWLACGLLAALNATLALLYWRLRRRRPVTAAGADGAGAADDSEAAAFRQLQSACAGGDAATAYRALQRWWQCFFGTASLPGPTELNTSGADQELLGLALALQRQLFGAAAADTWDGAALLDAVARQRAARLRDAPTPSLPPLYAPGTG